MSAEKQARAAVVRVVQTLLEATRALDGLVIETRGDAIAIEAARLTLRSIADPELRDLIDTVRQ